jgi:PAS domain S-box-containing protein
MSMQLSKDTLAGRAVVVIVYLAVIALTGGGILVGVWTARSMTAVVTEQFNAQQMVIAQTVKSRIEREIGAVKIEAAAMAAGLQGAAPPAAGAREILVQSMRRLIESGARQAGVVDLTARRALWCQPSGSCAERGLPEETPYDRIFFPEPPISGGPSLWVSPAQSAGDAAEMIMAVPLAADAARLLAVQVNVSVLLAAVIGNIHSGQTGYAWLIDQEGRFIHHPNPDFVGRNAFTVREEKFPGPSYEKINFIQKENMLRGEQGTGWYYSSWHRGITGPMKKLIAYCPIQISAHPHQMWSVAVAAPESEVEDALRRGSYMLFLLQGIVVLAVALGAGAIIWLEGRWSKILEAKVVAKTDALAKSEEKYRSLVESAEDFIFTVDREGRFQSLNTFTAGFFGGPPDAFVGRPISSVFPAAAAERQGRLIAQVFATGKSIREEFELPLGDRATWISANFMPIKNEAGETGLILCIARDITETKQLQRQLVNAEKLASLGTLAAGVAHEINNPLGVILGFCELLLRKAQKDTQQYEDLKTIERQGLLCKETVENLLSFARAEKQRQEAADLNACVREIVKIVRHLLEKNGIALALDLAGELPPVQGDTRQLQQVFLNLITNAMAAMPSGGSLSIRSRMERAARRAVVQFQDTGVGIAADEIDHIFEPFYTTKPEGQGTGLGLFVSYGIITSYGGSIECASTPASALGKQAGTTFTVKLPTAERQGDRKDRIDRLKVEG